MTLKLIASDLDATFLRADKTFNEPLFQQVLDIMAEKDMQFVVATGNHMQKVMAYFKILLVNIKPLLTMAPKLC